MSDYPPIDPTSYDLIILGTGLPESIIAAAAASAGKSVLHLDPNPFYGSQFASLKPTELSDFLSSHSSPPADSPSSNPATVVNLTSRSLFTDVEISNFAAEIVEKHARKFELDVSGPRALFCADKTIDTILKSGTNQYMEFKSIEASFIYSEGGVLMNVPDSRSAIFKDKSLSMVEKNKLMKFFKLVQQHFASDGSDEGRILEEDLESPYAQFLAKMGLPHKIKSIILYSIAMADYDQENMDCKDLLKTKDGIDRLALYQSSLGRFQNAAGAMIYPFHGQGELSQAFCRRAAVKGCIYVLRMPVISLHIDEENGQYKGVKLDSGQDLFSSRLVLGPSFTFPSNIASSTKVPTEDSDQTSSQKHSTAKVARGICITSASLNPGLSNLLVVYPPKSLFQGQVTAVRLLQLGSDLAVCPSGMFILYLSALCDDPIQGKELLNAAISALEVSQSNPIPETEDTEAAKPFLLWKALYIQEMASEHQFGSITSTPSPDGNLNYNVLLETTEKLFRTIYPNDAFFPEKDSSEDAENDDGLIEAE